MKINSSVNISENQMDNNKRLKFHLYSSYDNSLWYFCLLMNNK
jgi:hypothetical protein